MGERSETRSGSKDPFQAVRCPGHVIAVSGTKIIIHKSVPRSCGREQVQTGKRCGKRGAVKVVLVAPCKVNYSVDGVADGLEGPGGRGEGCEGFARSRGWA